MDDLCKDKSFTFPLLHQFEPYKKLTARGKSPGLKLLKRKGVYPYEHFTTYESLQTKRFPPREAFYSGLNETCISDEDYNHGKKVFKFFNCETMEDYMKLYCGLDVILLAEIFIKYREMVLYHFELDPIFYIGIPGLSFDVMLKMFYDNEKKEIEEQEKLKGSNSGNEEVSKPPGSLDLFDDPEMEQFFSKGIRGGQSFIATRHAKGNSNPNLPGDHLLYVDGKC